MGRAPPHAHAGGARAGGHGGAGRRARLDLHPRLAVRARGAGLRRGGGPPAMTGSAPARFAAVLFDWDGTLVDTAEASYRCYVKLFDSYGLSFDREAFART